MLSAVAARKQAAPRPIGRLCSNVRNGIVTETGSREGGVSVGSRDGSALLPSSSLPARDHPARDLALSPLHPELPRTCAFRKRRTRSIVRCVNSSGSFHGNTVISAFGASEATSIEVCSGCPGTSSGSTSTSTSIGVRQFALGKSLGEAGRRKAGTIFPERDGSVGTRLPFCPNGALPEHRALYAVHTANLEIVAKSGSQWTRRWREMDSNFRFRASAIPREAD